MELTFQEIHSYIPTEEDIEFERVAMKALEGKTDKHFYAKIKGVTFANPDGSSREELIGALQPFQMLSLIRERDNQYDPMAVSIETLEGRKLGYLGAYEAEEIARQFDEHGRIWLPFVRYAAGAAPGRHACLVVLLVRITEEYVIAHPS